MKSMTDWFPVYRELARLNLNNPEIRKDKKTIGSLNLLGLQSDSLEAYWKRVMFIAENSYGNVLEIGCAMGNITRYISENEYVKNIFAFDILTKWTEFLKQLNLDKVNVYVKNLITESLNIASNIDCVIMSELIEHITTSDEINILEHIRNNIDNDTKFIITTPIGFMEDPDHIRGFSRIECIIHIVLFYGRIIKKYDNGIQQFYIVQRRNRTFIWNCVPYSVVDIWVKVPLSSLKSGRTYSQ